MMITAKEINSRISEVDPLVDKLIEQKVAPEMVNRSIKRVTISAKSVSQFYIDNGSYMNVGRLLSQFKLRGFYIKHYCDDTPFGECWYEISIPPQEE